MLAAIAGRTERIHLGSAVTVLSSDDPVRVFQRFATLDAASERARRGHPRARLVHRVVSAVRLSARQYEELFEEKLELFAQLLDEAARDLERRDHAARRSIDQRVFPHDRAGRLTTWVGVGGSPQSVVRAARYGLPARCSRSSVVSARASCRSSISTGERSSELGNDRAAGRRAFARPRRPTTDEEAMEELWPHWQAMRNRIGAERGWPATTPEEFDAASPAGALYVGSPETVAAQDRRNGSGARPRRGSR